MPKKEPVGLIVCPACDFKDAEVFNDKSGHLYVACSECGAQLFAHGDKKRAEGIKRKMRAAVTGQAAAPAAASPAASSSAPGAAAPAASSGTAGQASGSGDPPPKKKGGFRTLLDRDD